MRSAAVSLGAVALIAASLASSSWAQDRGGGVLNFGDDKKDNTRENDEEFAKRLMELIAKTVAESERDVLDQTPVSAFEGPDREVAQTIYRTLDVSRISLNLDGVEFDEAIGFLRDVTDLNIVVSRRAQDIVQAGTTKLKLRLKDVKVRNAFELILTQTDKDLRYGIRNGVLEVGTPDDWKGRNLVLDVIPIDDLLFHPPDFPAPEAGLDALKPKWKK
jgi:hypothetical protein